MRHIRWTFACLIACGALAGCNSGPAQTPSPAPPEVKVEVALPATREVTDYEDFTGRTDAIRLVTIVARVSGYLVSTPFKEGAIVNKGDLLFEIDARPYQAQVDQGEAQLRLNEAHAKQARNDNARAKDLSKTPGAISSQDLDKYEAAELEATASVRAARANLEAYRIDLNFCRVKSPISGRVGRYFLTPGNLITKDQTPLTTVVSRDPIYVYFDIDERTLLRIQQVMRQENSRGTASGAPVRLGLSTETGFPHEGVVDFMDNVVDPQTGTLRARGVFANPDSALTPGLFARVRLQVGEPYEALLVPEKALGTKKEERYLYVVNDKNQAEIKTVTTGPSRGELRVILKGISRKDRVVVRGLQWIKHSGDAVTPTSVDATSPTTPAETDSETKAAQAAVPGKEPAMK